MKVREPIPREHLIHTARGLRSKHGGNPEYDRALVELCYWAAGGASIYDVMQEVLKDGPAPPRRKAK